jgi:hypothetical protein
MKHQLTGNREPPALEPLSLEVSKIGREALAALEVRVLEGAAGGDGRGGRRGRVEHDNVFVYR